MKEELLCPNCGCNNLHQENIDVYTRESEDGDGQHIHIPGEDKWAFCGSPKFVPENHVDTNMGDNPSSRRNGLLIHFWCEQCDRRSVMSIAQHKGVTQMAMGVYEIDWKDPT